MNVSIISFDYSDSVKFIYEKLRESNENIDYCVIGEQTKEKICELSDLAEKSSDIIFYVGGQGLSMNDILKEVLAERYGVNLVYSKETQEFFRKYIEESKQPTPPIFVQEKLLSFPEGFEVFQSKYGYEMSAIGRFCGKEIILLPDSLAECRHMYYDYLKNFLEKKDGQKHKVFFYKVFGLKQDEVEKKLSAFEKKSFKISVKTDFAEDSEITVRCNGRVSQTNIDEMNAFMLETFSENLYSVDDFSLSQVAVDLLKLYGRKLSVAESLTGGKITSDLVDVPGASDVLYEGCTTYSNGAKQARLLVKHDTLSRCGAVSSETAYQMCTGLLKTSGCDVVLSTPGIAGPGGGSAVKPVGLTYIAVGDGKGIHIHKFVFAGDRNEVREKAAKNALFLLIKFIKKRK